MVRREDLVAWLNSVEWLRPDEISPQAELLIADHLAKVRAVIEEVMASKRVNAVDAHAIAQTAGHATPEGEALLDDLFSKVTFGGAGVRTSLICTIAAAYCWGLDPELCRLPNPWTPLVDLYGIGYTTSGVDDPAGGSLTLTVGHKGGTRSYRII